MRDRRPSVAVFVGLATMAFLESGTLAWRARSPESCLAGRIGKSRGCHGAFPLGAHSRKDQLFQLFACLWRCGRSRVSGWKAKEWRPRWQRE